MDYQLQYQIIKVQALRFHALCRHFELYTEPMDEARFLSVIEPFLIRVSRAAEPKFSGPQRLGATLEAATRELERFMAPYLPAGAAGLRPVLERLIGELYQGLIDARLLAPGGMCVRALTETRLPYFGLTVQAIADGQESLASWCISLPSSLLGRMVDVVPQMAWDREWGGQGLLECIEQYFAPLPFEFTWQYDQEANRVTCRVDAHTWAIENVTLQEYDGLWDDAKVYEETFRQLRHYFARHRLTLIDVPSWGQLCLWLLVPSGQVEQLDRFLGRRDGDFYLMVPHLAVPSEIE